MSTRRDFLLDSARYAAAAAAGVTALGELPLAAADADQPIIDCHVHFNRREPVLRHQAETISRVDYSAAGLLREMEASNVEKALFIGFETADKELSRTAANPLGWVDFQRDAAAFGDKAYFVGGVNPHRLEAADLQTIDQVLASGRMKGLKIYLGYYHFFPDDDRYKPLYELAGKHDVPVMLHTGDTYSSNAKVRFAHPLRIDDVAVDFRQVKFVLCHLGNPWTIDAAELLYKNPNVYADLSGFLVGDEAYFADAENDEGIGHAVERIRRALAWVENPEKILYGSDWPLAPMHSYLQFVKRAIPERDFRKVFYGNARTVFKL